MQCRISRRLAVVSSLLTSFAQAPPAHLHMSAAAIRRAAIDVHPRGDWAVFSIPPKMIPLPNKTCLSTDGIFGQELYNHLSQLMPQLTRRTDEYDVWEYNFSANSWKRAATRPALSAPSIRTSSIQALRPSSVHRGSLHLPKQPYPSQTPRQRYEKTLISVSRGRTSFQPC